MKPSCLALAVAIVVATPLGAESLAPKTAAVLLEASSPADLRARLLEHASRVESADRGDAGEAYYWTATSYARAGLQDSAVQCYRRAVELRGQNEDRFALVDALLRRRTPADVKDAIQLIESNRSNAEVESATLGRAYTARLAWANVLAGRPDTAVALFQPIMETFSRRWPTWRFRMAAAHMNGDPRIVYRLLLPLAAASRGQDAEVTGMLREVSEGLGGEERVSGAISDAIASRDEGEKTVILKMGGRRVRFTAHDGFPLGGVVLPAPDRPHPRAAVVVMAPGDTLAIYDSLGVALRRAGLAVILLDVRGSGYSVARVCPLPDTWDGREERLHTLAARDVQAALSALGGAVPLDSSRYLVVGIGSTASIAVEAAERDPRVNALLLVSPKPAPVERGPMRARLARLQVPAFFQSGVEDLEQAGITDALYQAGNRRGSRVAEARRMGTGPLQFYRDPSIAIRLIGWLEETMPRAARRVARPSPRRGG